MAVEPASVMPDEVVVDEVDEPQGTGKVEGTEGTEWGDQGEEVIIEEEGSLKTEDVGLRKENQELKNQLFEVGQELKSLKDQFADLAKKPKAQPTEVGEGEITQEQLIGLMEEHKDNPQVLLRIFNYVSEQQAKRIATGIRDETVKNVEFQNWHRDLKTHNDAIMLPIFEADPELRRRVSESTKRLALDQHPMGELLVHSLISYAKQQGDKAKSADEAERADKLLKQKGIDKTRTAGDKGSRGAKGLSKEQKDIADKLGISYDSYAKFVPKEKE